MLLWILLTKNLEHELLEELHKKEPEFFYEVREKKTGLIGRLNGGIKNW